MAQQLHPYSQRLPWSSSPNRLSQCLAEKRAAGNTFLDLTISNPTQALADYPHTEIAAAYASIDNFNYHPQPFGDLPAQEAVVSYYAEKGVAVAENQIALTASTSEAYSLLFKLLCDPGDEILTPIPSYPLFEHLAALESVRTVPYHLHYAGDWYVDLHDLQNAITPRTRAIVVVNPSNPAGCYSKEHEAMALLNIAAQHRMPVIVDEVFFDYPIPQGRSLPPSYCRYHQTLIFVLNGLSKLAGMPQMKLGWIVLNGPQKEQAGARRRLELILDTYLSVATPIQKAARPLFQIGSNIHAQLHERIISNLRTTAAILRGSPLTCLNVEGGWSAVLQLPDVLAEEEWVLRLLNESSVVVQPGYFFDMPADPCIVISLITPPEIFEHGITEILSFVSKVLK
ncbi:MAG TPA: pyridoxal phosphate-dependent aminotransferase [Bryobacteraceae bacterium]|nr:pyridoxal phosphate-dependent aminotransferase [Bryobacteraceae bacterium]